MNILKIDNSVGVSNNYRRKKQNNQMNSKFSIDTLNKQVSFGSFFDVFHSRSPKKFNDIVGMIKNKELSNTGAFKQLEKFLKENNLHISVDDSRKKYKAKPYYFTEIENVGYKNTKAHGYGNTHEGAISNLIVILSEWKERGLLLGDFNSNRKLEIPDFDKNDLQKLKLFLRAEFEKFRNK